ncbi:methylated-DNA-[protein]-cysteine S-methyltransferase [Andreprevotia lacus DSM 23236]|jgi:methylated-DNA-[protein]-cysteine S-methyltransferase|uniref:Methylated-DNA-[protein]-cysteine S-methyltransferase n=1 Tax=Andreprevotia lacus DSM 23236 TaxID=1121001 RepID=A0A1W1WXT8_9NEIS|nr:methylated-DNA--[protein]-cysteine S-methyltransferase [Andreprevotia lacus]SMC15921.1 methylated-DNA-[protein]-cysteine S-methyltransferase [Andreprevotia lacus DSM 23236]
MADLRPFNAADYQAVIDAPFSRIGLGADGDVLVRIDFVLPTVPLQAPQSAILREAAGQVAAYLQDPLFQFDLPYRLQGSLHQRKVWQRIAAIPSGEVIRYADLAQDINSVARAVGGACGANPLPLLIPCHRVVAADGLGGFNARRNGVDWLPVKRWLLKHEGVLRDWFD